MPHRPYRAPKRKRSFLYWAGCSVFLIFSLILPGLALMKTSHEFKGRNIILYVSALSGATVYAYWSDKKKAENNAWRIPEKTLHILEILGGWSAAYISQRLFRHKIAKTDYQITFWLIGILHQYVSFDYLRQWHVTPRILQFLESLLKG